MMWYLQVRCYVYGGGGKKGRVFENAIARFSRILKERTSA